MKFAIEAYSEELVSEMVPLWKAHYNETHDDLYGPFDPDLKIYRELSKAGAMRIFTVRNGGGRLHGYQVFFVSPDPHSVGQTQAVQDILYVCPDARKGMFGLMFLKWCVEQLKGEVDTVHQRISAKHDFGPVLERLGFRLEDLNYARRV